MSQPTNMQLRPGLAIAARRQRGAISLMIGMILLIATTILTFSVGRTSLMESRMVNNSYRASEATQAAEAGLEYANAWLTENLWDLNWVVGADGMETSAPNTAMPDIATANGDQYSTAITFSRDPGNASFIQVTSVATAVSDTSITATVTQYMAPDGGPLHPGLNSPPVVIDGCLDNVTGTPDIVPQGWESGTGAGPFGTAIGTSQPATRADGSDCIQLGHMGTNGGSVDHEVFSGDAWDYMFAKSRAEIKALADAEVATGVPDAERRYIWVTSTANYDQSWGSEGNPVVLVFAPEADCPKINGSPVIYGVVFVDGDCSSTNGWGGTTVYGTVVVNGDVSQVTANTEVYHYSELTGGDGIPFLPDDTAKVLGTWADF